MVSERFELSLELRTFKWCLDQIILKERISDLKIYDIIFS